MANGRSKQLHCHPIENGKKLAWVAVSCHKAGMKKHLPSIPTVSRYTLLQQISSLIPPHLVPKLARETGVASQERTFSSWSHTIALMYAHLTHAIGLNDVCDALRLNRGPLSALRGATPPSRNNLSHANKSRDAILAEKLFWSMLEHLQTLTPSFIQGRPLPGYWRRFRRAIHIVDSTTLQLVVSCMDWAKHRRRKAAAKCHLRLDLQSFLPRFAILTSAREADNRRSRELCAGLREGEIAIFDKAYTDYWHFWELTQRGVWWVTRAKGGFAHKVVRTLKTTSHPRILRDELIRLSVPISQKAYPGLLRRVVARVEVDGQERDLEFLSNNLQWSAWTIAELYRCRWQIEIFFKEIKQTLQLSDFLGHSENAVRWQVWIGLLVHLLLRYLAWIHQWSHSFTRLFTIVRAVLWRRWSLTELLRCYGTAGGSIRLLSRPEQVYLPGFG